MDNMNSFYFCTQKSGFDSSNIFPTYKVFQIKLYFLSKILLLLKKGHYNFTYMSFIIFFHIISNMEIRVEFVAFFWKYRFENIHQSAKHCLEYFFYNFMTKYNTLNVYIRFFYTSILFVSLYLKNKLIKVSKPGIRTEKLK